MMIYFYVMIMFPTQKYISNTLYTNYIFILRFVPLNFHTAIHMVI